jgi:hypothetical protein
LSPEIQLHTVNLSDGPNDEDTSALELTEFLMNAGTSFADTRTILRSKSSKKPTTVGGKTKGEIKIVSIKPRNLLRNSNIKRALINPAKKVNIVASPAIFKEIQRDDDIKTVIIAAYWIASLTEFVPVGSSLGEEIRKAVDLITGAGKDVYLIVDNHSFSFPPEGCRYSRFPGKAPRCTEDKAVFLDQLALYINEFRKIEAENSKVRILDPTDLLCDAKNC